MYPEHSQVVLTCPLPALGLEPGDVGVIIHVNGSGVAYEVEFMSLDGPPLAFRRSLRARFAPSVPVPRATSAYAPQPDAAGQEGVPDVRETYELPEGLHRRSVPAFDDKVLRELLVNALVTRPYIQRGDIFLNLHTDRLEVPAGCRWA